MASGDFNLQKFSLNLYKILGAGKENFFLSPQSIASALMLVCLGAKGETFKQIIDVLGIQNEDTAHEVVRALNEQFIGASGPGIETNSANKLFTSKDLKLLETFEKSMDKFFDGSIEGIDFSVEPEACRAAINEWVEKQTNYKISDLLGPGAITPNTNMVLVNAIYFKGLWEKPFRSVDTVEMDFNVSARENVKVKMMKSSQQIPYVTHDELALSAVAIPYKGHAMKMVVLLPNMVEGLALIERNITWEHLDEICQKLLTGRKHSVDIFFPKFKMAIRSELIPALQEMGIADLFDPCKVDLTGLFQSDSSPVTDIIHKAFIEVNEEGTEAAAATAMMSRMMLLPVEKVSFRCDHPFLFFVMQNTSNNIIFTGKFCRPEQ